jgi:hypothetical protein
VKFADHLARFQAAEPNATAEPRRRPGRRRSTRT